MLASLFGGGLLARALPYLIAVVVGGVLVVGIYRAGYNAAKRVHQVAVVETKIKTLERDNEIKENALEEERAETERLRREMAGREERADALRKELELRKSVCTIDDAALELLRKSSGPGGN